MKFDEAVIEIIQQTYDVKSFRFKRPFDFDYKAGQYMLITLNVLGKKMRKPFTISSSPTEKEHIEFTKKLTGHDFSNALDALVTGDVVGIEGPYGQMTFEGEYDKIALLSGGIGITPMISICRYCTDMELGTRITLVSSNKTEKDIAFKDELEQMQLKNKNLKVVHTLTRAGDEWKGCRERICENLIAREIPDHRERVFYLCGPPNLMEFMVPLMNELGIPEERVKKEYFTEYQD
ncbi:MAG: xylene monooxygenase [Methanosarcinaceae archaeon]|nr:xylene monooxygenase [Methanosarcinaceae archaeon]